MTEPRGASIDRDALDAWMRDRGLMLIRNSHFADLTRELAAARQTATRLHEELAALRRLEHRFTLEPDEMDALRRWACSCGEFGGWSERSAEWTRNAWLRHVERAASAP